MSKWIDVDALKARIDQEVKEDKVLSGWAFFFKVYLDEESSIDIVRCKECKHASNNKVYGCSLIDFNTDEYHRMYADDFCSYGERRANES